MTDHTDGRRSRGREPALGADEMLPVPPEREGIAHEQPPAPVEATGGDETREPEAPERVMGLGTALARVLAGAGLMAFGLALAAAAWLFYEPGAERAGPPRYVLSPDGPPGTVVPNPDLHGGAPVETPDAVVDAGRVQPADLPPIALLGRPGGEDADPAAAAEVAELLQRARDSLEALRLTTPAENSAYFYYQQVLALDPVNTEAEAGMGRIAERYAWLVDREIGRGQLERARGFLELGRRIRPDHPDLQRASSSLDAAEQQAGGAGGGAMPAPPPPF